MMMKSVLWWRKPEYPEETTDLRQVSDETFHTVTCHRSVVSSGYSGCLRDLLNVYKEHLILV